MGDPAPVAPAPAPWRQQDFARRLEDSIERGANHLLSLQDEEGYWLGELEADTTLESDYIYYLFVLGKADPAAHCQAGELCAAAAIAGWRLESFIPAGRRS